MNNQALPLIEDIKDGNDVISFVPCGIIVCSLDQSFNILEINDGYCRITGYSREEVRDVFGNKGINTIYPDDRIGLLEYFQSILGSSQQGNYQYVARAFSKDKGILTLQLGGRIFNDKIYVTFMDITEHTQNLKKLKEEMNFNALIASLTDNVFYDYDIILDSMRFSKNFADRLEIEEIIPNFVNSAVAYKLQPIRKDITDNIDCKSNTSKNLEGELSLSFPTGETAYYLYTGRVVCTGSGDNCHMVGKMIDITSKKLELDALKLKSEIDQLTGIYNKTATERYIYDYLKNPTKHSKSALLVIDLDNFKQINDNFGHIYGDKCLSDIGHILRSTFRTSDILGRIGGDEFFVFIKEYDTIDLIKRKAMELNKSLQLNYELDGVSVDLSSSIGIALYPEHGDSFKDLYEKADKTMYSIKQKGKNNFALYGEQ